MNHDWQSIAALTVVLVTLGVFVIRAMRKRGAPGCGGSCGCEAKMKKPARVK